MSSWTHANAGDVRKAMICLSTSRKRWLCVTFSGGSVCDRISNHCKQRDSSMSVTHNLSTAFYDNLRPSDRIKQHTVLMCGACVTHVVLDRDVAWALGLTQGIGDASTLAMSITDLWDLYTTVRPVVEGREQKRDSKGTIESKLLDKDYLRDRIVDMPDDFFYYFKNWRTFGVRVYELPARWENLRRVTEDDAAPSGQRKTV